MNGLLFDARLCVRALLRTKGMAAGAALAIALGVAATTTLFSIVHQATRGLPFDDAEELVVLSMIDPRSGSRDLGVRPFDYGQWVEQQRSFEGLAAFRTASVSLAEPGGRPERASAAQITPNTFALLGVAPRRGAQFTTEDVRSGAPLVLISDALWRRRFEADPGTVGRTLRINSEAHTVVGIMPPGFGFPIHEDLWLPLRIDAAAAPGEGADLRVFGRLREGASAGQARSELANIVERVARAHPDTHGGLGARVIPYVDMEMDPEVVPILYLMLLAVSFVLVIACANVANLLLARAAMRVKEVAVRSALGAARHRIMLQHLLESMLIALAGGVGGTIIAAFAVRYFDGATAGIIEAFWIDFRVDRAALAFTAGLIALSGILAGILPALRASRVAPASFLGDESRGVTGMRIGRVSRTLVVVELALACGLLAVSATLVTSGLELRRIDVPFDARGIFTAELGLYGGLPGDVAAYDALRQELDASLRRIPGVRAAALVSTYPGRGSGVWEFGLDGRPAAAATTTRVAFVTPGFFDVLDAPVRRGRGFDAGDHRRSPLVAVVNEGWVRRWSQDADPIGRHLELGMGGPITIVGVVPDLQIQDVDDARSDGLYLAAAQHDIRTDRIVARTSGPPLDVAAAVHDAVEAANPDVPLFEIATLRDAMYADAQVLDAFGVLFSLFGVGALILTLVGLYGVVSFGVIQRTREFGVRMALGASGVDILALVLRQGARAVLLGTGIGIGLGFALTSVLGSAVDALQPAAAWQFAAVSATLLVAAGLALLLPAARAAALRPLDALRG